nr:hypothetical protein GCM10020092_037840 [Actinoplanes digitatis]
MRTCRRGVSPARVAGGLGERESARVASAARARGLTLNTVVQGAWALVLAQLTGRWDVVFGSTVSGRLEPSWRARRRSWVC